MSEPTTAPETYAGWRNRVAQAFLKVYSAEDQGRTARSNLGRLGIDAKVTSEATGLTIAIADEDNQVPLPYDTKREQFTAAALAEMEAHHIRLSKSAVWHEIRVRAENSYSTGDLVTALLDELGYSQADRPAKSTVVGVRLNLGTNKYGEQMTDRKSFTMPGEVSKDAVIAQMVEAFPEHAGTTGRLQAAFPSATGLTKPFEDGSVSVSSTLKWPDTCEFDNA
jgi:hypothetical protein